MKEKNTASVNINSREMLKIEYYVKIPIDVNSTKISSHNAKVDFPLILFDLHVCYSELSFKRNPEILF